VTHHKISNYHKRQSWSVPPKKEKKKEKKEGEQRRKKKKPKENKNIENANR
jgi:hypothetical protein